MYVFKTRSRLTPFYAVVSSKQLQVNLESIQYLNCILAKYAPEFRLPTTINLATIDRYVNGNLSSSLIDLLVSELYQTFLLENLSTSLVNIVVIKLNRVLLLKKLSSTDIINRVWINFTHYINSAKLVPKLWNQLPVYKRTNEKLELFQNAAFLSPVKLFTNFDPKYDDLDLLTSIERWTYRSLRNFIYGQIRDRGEPLFGLKDLGVVAKLTLTYIRNIRSGYVSKEQLRSDTFLVQTFKNYLKGSSNRTNQLQPNDWEKIHQEVERQWHKLELYLPSPSIEKIKQDLDAIGDCVRKASEMKPMDSLDRVLNSDNGEQTLGDKELKDDINLEDRDSLDKGCKQLLPVLEAAIAKLDPSNSAILKMRYQEELMQQEIAKKIGKDQSYVSRRLRIVHQCLLKAIHQRIDNPNNSDSKVNQASITAMKQSLKDERLYQN